MRQNNIAYENLRVEMARVNINLSELAAACGYNRDTLSRKLSKKSPINLDDAFKIQQTIFPSLSIKYLFNEDFERQAPRPGEGAE